MKTYEVTPMKMEGAGVQSKDHEPRFPSVCIPVEKDWITKLKAGKDITVTLSGKLTDISLHEPEGEYSRNEIRMEVHKVEMDESGEYKELLDA